MKVLLLTSTAPEYILNEKILSRLDNLVPIGLLYLGAILKRAGHTVKLIDVHNNFIIGRQVNLKNEVNFFKPDLVGVNCFVTGRFKSAINICNQVKEANVNIPVVMGGIHSSMLPKEIMEEYKCIDYICLGEGEKFILDLMHAHFNDKSALKDIDGIAYREHDKIVINPKTMFIQDLDEIPFPDYDLIDIHDYWFDTSKWFNPKKLPINVSLPIISSRSCPNKCTFCSNYLIQGRKWRARSAKNVVDEIEFLYKKYNQHYFSFLDDNLTLSKKRILDICNEILARKLDIQFDTPNGLSIKTLDKEILDSMTKAGLIRVSVAVEHGSEYMRNSVMKKNLSTKAIYDFFKYSKNYKNLTVKAFFVIGYPQETRETLQETYDMIQKISPYLDFLGMFFVSPFPGTEVFTYCQKHSLINLSKEDIRDGNYYAVYTNYNDSDLPMIKPYELTLEDLVNFRDKAKKLVRRRYK